MNKDDILKKSIEENKDLDEREKQEVSNSFGLGGAVVAGLCCIFSIIKAFKGQTFYEFGVIIFGYLAGNSWYSYKITKKKTYLIQAIACSFATILGLNAFFFRG